MERCPLCRAMLHGADTCRRCRAELALAQQAERESEARLLEAMHCLALGNTVVARQRLLQALSLHATPEVRVLWRVSKEGQGALPPGPPPRA